MDEEHSVFLITEKAGFNPFELGFDYEEECKFFSQDDLNRTHKHQL